MGILSAIASLFIGTFVISLIVVVFDKIFNPIKKVVGAYLIWIVSFFAFYSGFFLFDYVIQSELVDDIRIITLRGFLSMGLPFLWNAIKDKKRRIIIISLIYLAYGIFHNFFM